MDVGVVIACVLSAMAGTGIGLVGGGLLGAGKHDDLTRRLADLSAKERHGRSEVARLTAELDRLSSPAASRRKPRLAAGHAVR